MNKNEIIQLAADAGKIILENGGETYRVENTIKIICSSYKFPQTESYVTPTGIIISVTDINNNTVSLIKRIESRGVNLEKVCMVNNLSRKISKKPLPIAKVQKELDYINSSHKYSQKITTFFSALASGSFCLLFGGNIRDFFVSCFIGILITLLLISLGKLEVNNFFTNILGGSLAALIALLSVYIGLGTNEDKIVIGSIMLLVPGLAITNAVRDTISGDLVSGVSRSIEAFFVAVAIAVGTGVTFKLWILLLGGM